MSELGTIDHIAEINPRSPSAASGEPVSFVAMADVSEQGRLNSVEVRNAVAGYTPFVEGDVLVAKITPCLENGKGAHARNLPVPLGLGSTEFHVLRARSRTSARYLYHLTRTDRFRLQAEALMTGSAGQRRVPTEFFSRYEIRVPPLKEQRRIAEILDTIDEAIQTTEGIIAKRRALQAGLAADLLTAPSAVAASALAELGSGSLQCSSDNTSANSVLSGWESRSIEELVASVSSGGTPRAGDPRYYSESGTPFLKIDDITKSSGRYVEEAAQSITDLALDESAAKVFPTGTVVVTMYGTMGVTKTLSAPMATNQAIAALVPPFRCDPHYLAFALSFRRAGLERFAAQTTQPNISGTIIRRFRLPIPPLEEQRRIAEILDTVDSTIQHNKAELVKLCELREGLAAELLSGRVRTVAT